MRESKGTASPHSSPRPAIKLTHPDRVYWTDAGVTKQGLADYYAEVWPRMAPFIVNRPLALVRCPDGVGGQCFFQKHAWSGQSKDILTAHDPKDDDEQPIIAIDGLPGLIGLAQGGVLEIHPWGSRLDDLEQPDMIIMDLDPGDGVDWTEIIEAAGEVRERLRNAGLEGFVKTSGGKGLHVVAPLKPAAEWDEVKAFTKALADAMSADSPDRFVATVTKSKRKGKILVDYLRNGRGATAVAPYSTRARPGAAVSMPLDWDELEPGDRPGLFHGQQRPAETCRPGRRSMGGFLEGGRALKRWEEVKARGRVADCCRAVSANARPRMPRAAGPDRRAGPLPSSSALPRKIARGAAPSGISSVT